MNSSSNPYIGTDGFVSNRENGNPWMATATYEEKDEFRFKGRKEDTNKVLSMLQQNECVVCYAASGDGKSSLINAGLCPSLRRLGLFPIKITFSTNEYKGIDLPIVSEQSNLIDFDRLMATKIEQSVENYKKKFVSDHKIDGEYEITFEKISKFENVDISDSLWWKLRTETIQIPFGEFDYLPVLIFDQFEEIFRATWKAEFFRWLETFMKETCPNDIVARYNGKSDDLPTKRLFRVIFSMRYEYIGELDYWCSQHYFIPQLIKNRYFLRALNLQQAREVVTEQCCGDEFAQSTIRCKADDIIKRLLDEKNQNSCNATNEISAILLSILCFTYYNQILEKNDTNLPSAKDLVKTYYNRTCDEIFYDIPNILPLIEKELVSSDGTRKRIRRKDVDGVNIIVNNDSQESCTIGDLLLSRNILRKYNINNEEYIELVHDKIAEVVKDKLDEDKIKENNKKKREKNIKIRRNIENVLTVSGRELFNNQYYIGESNFERQSALSTILHIAEKPNNSASETAYRTSIAELIKGSFMKKSMISMTIMGDDFQEYPFKDGVYYVVAGLIESGNNRGKIEKVRFLDKQRNILFTRNGYCGMNLKYDDCGNEISRVYVGNDQKAIYNIHCYAEIRRYYDDNNMPIKTRYFSPEGKLCSHYEGNCGYDSVYDNNGNERQRIYVGEDGEPCQLSNGIWGQEYEYNFENQIICVSNLGKNKERSADDSGCVSVKYVYDESGNIIKEIYCDEKWNHVCIDKGYCILNTIYNSLGLIECQEYYDDKEVPVMRTDGYFRIKIEYDCNGWPISISYHDIDDNCVITEGAAIVKRMYDEIGLEKEIHFLAPDGSPMYDKNGRCQIKIEYNSISKLPQSFLFCNHNGEVALTKGDICCKIKKVWDETGRNVLKEEYYSYSTDEPSEILTYKWLTPFNFIVYSSNGNTQKHIKWNYKNLPVYEEDLIAEQQYHHKCMSYNERGWLIKELYCKKDNTPHIDELGDIGTEYIYDESGQLCGFASIGDDGERHINYEGWAVKKWMEKIDKNHVNKNYYYFDVDGITPIMIKEGYHRLVEGDDGYEATYDLDNLPVNNRAGYAKCKVKREDGIVSFSYYDQNNDPVCFNGCHRIVNKLIDQEMTKLGLYGIEYFNEKGLPVNINGFSKRIIKKCGVFAFSEYIICYYDSNGKPADGPIPRSESKDRGHKLYIDSDYDIYYVKSKDGKVITNNFYKQNTIDLIKAIIIIIAIPIYSVYLLCKYLFVHIPVWMFRTIGRQMGLYKGGKIDSVQLISIKELVTQDNTSIANLANLLPLDIILSYGSWRYTDYGNTNDAINEFEKMFNLQNGNYKPITIGRIHENSSLEPEIFCFWVPGQIGIQLADEKRDNSSGKVSVLLRKYRELLNDNFTNPTE